MPVTERRQLVQQLLKKIGFNNYLEIGIFFGRVFFHVNARNKIAVDPHFKFSRARLFKRRLKSLSNMRAKLFEETSDVFFEKHAASVLKKPLHVCLVDGMHEFEFALRDVLNCLEYLDKDGVIIMHDCNPPTAEHEISFKEWEADRFKNEWNGDVWKTIVYLRSVRRDLNIFVADCDHGLGIITKRKPSVPALDFISADQVKQLSFQQLNENRQHYLNLQPASYLEEFFSIKNL
ncbi:MAG: hypothetical protein JWN76_1976 [Chitinophagaceae bacterium]|nr:hypothetical protein [Chitinophagaceae bacterium]